MLYSAALKMITSRAISLSSLVSIIRGQVLTADGTPLIGVNVTFVHYPEHGYTVTRKDGMCVFISYLYTTRVTFCFLCTIYIPYSCFTSLLFFVNSLNIQIRTERHFEQKTQTHAHIHTEKYVGM